ncbi:MAG: hypothetical protein RJS98_10050 [Rhodospirillaceae bacterium]
MYLRARILSVSALVIALDWSVIAAHAQGNPLEAICQGFLSSSGVPTPGNANILCDCLVREVQSNLTRPEMQSYQSSVEAGRPLPKALETKIMAVATSCLTQAQ